MAHSHSDGRPRRREPPILLKRFDHGREVVAACCAQAASHGVQPDMTMAHACALLPRVQPVVQVHEPEADRRSLKRLARWALRIAPIVAVDEPDGLLLDLTGCHTLYRDELVLLKRIRRSLNRLGFSVRLAMAGTFSAAAAMARYGGDALTVIAPRTEREAICALPIAALRPEASTLDALHEVGLETIDQLLRLPRADLVARFGWGLLAALDRATGLAVELINPVRPAAMLQVERCFSGPVLNLEAILLASRQLLEELVAKLRAREAGVRQLEIRLDRIDTAPIWLSIPLSRPSRRLAHLWLLVRPQLEEVNLGFGVEQIVMQAPLLGRLRHEQMATCGEGWPEPASASPFSAAAGELVDTLVDRLGPERVLAMQPVESHVPERAARLTPCFGEPITLTGVLDADRPSLLFERPEEVEVMAMIPDGPPCWMRWGGSERRLIAAFGPERINREWWRDQTEDPGSHRDYFKVQTDAGQWLWLFRAASTSRWYVHGAWA
jgi:protein ImuB